MKVKKIIPMILVAMLMSMTSYGQDDVFAGSLTVGGQAHLSLGNMYPVIGDSYSFKTGYAVGIFTEYRIIDILAVGVGGLYHPTGANSVDPDQFLFDSEPIKENIETMDIRLTKFEIPVHVALYLGNIKAFGGGSYNFIQSVEATIIENVDGLKGKSELDMSERFMLDQGAVFFGIGYGFSFGSIRVYPEVQYNLGITNINNITGKEDLFHDYFTVGVKFGYGVF